MSSWQKSIRSAALAGGIVAAFLLVFQPFQIEVNSWFSFWAITGFGAVTFLMSLLVELLLRRFIMEYFKGNLAFGFMYAANISFIAIGNLLYSIVMFDNSNAHFLELLFWALVYTALVGLIPLTFFFILHFWKKHEAAQQKIAEQAEIIEVAEKSKGVLALEGDGRGEILKLNGDQILYLQAQDNYVIIQYLDNHLLKNHLLRASLSKLEKQLAGTTIKRCHRSFLVNMDKVKTIRKGSNNLQLLLNDTSDAIPVSQKYADEIKTTFLSK